MERISKYIKSFSVLFLALSACKGPFEAEFPKSFAVEINNPSNTDRRDAMVLISAEEIYAQFADFNAHNFVVLDQGVEIPSQFNQQDSSSQGLVFILDRIKGNEKKKLSIRYNPEGQLDRNYPKRTQAELSHKTNGEWANREYIGGEFKNVDYLRVPAEHKDHSWFLRYEGPGWESDKVGYRFYLDQRNAVDIFGKKTSDMVLQQVGLDGFDSYHKLQDWGMDILKVAKSLGVGSIGMLADKNASRIEFTDSVTAQITENGAVYSSILTKYFGWKTTTDTLDVVSRLSIHGGTRLSRQHLSLSSDSETLCTGLIKDSKAKLFTSEGGADKWGYIATYGPQSLNDNDLLGIAVLFNPSSFKQFTEDDYSHIVSLSSTNQSLEYYFLGAWEGEPGGIKNEQAFLDYLNQITQELAQPLQMEITKN